MENQIGVEWGCQKKCEQSKKRGVSLQILSWGTKYADDSDMRMHSTQKWTSMGLPLQVQGFVKM